MVGACGGPRIACAHVTTPRSQSARFRRLDRSAWRRRADHARRNRRESRCRPARPRSPARRRRLGAHATGARPRRLETTRGRTARSGAVGGTGPAQRPQRQARSRHRDRGAARFVAGCHTADGQTHRRRSNGARAVHEQRRSAACHRRRSGFPPTDRHAHHVQRNLPPVISGGYDDRAAKKATPESDDATGWRERLRRPGWAL